LLLVVYVSIDGKEKNLVFHLWFSFIVLARYQKRKTKGGERK
jgi:hypothetical protein